MGDGDLRTTVVTGARLICDANETIFPDDLMVPGRVLRIPRNKL